MFGGDWTSTKLAIREKYTVALKDDPTTTLNIATDLLKDISSWR